VPAMIPSAMMALMRSRVILPVCRPHVPAFANLRNRLLPPCPSAQASIAMSCTSVPASTPVANNRRSRSPSLQYMVDANVYVKQGKLI
jgi:hypothetical protein